MDFWNGFWKLCKSELSNVSYYDFAILAFIGAVFVHLGCMTYVNVKKQMISLRTEIYIIILICYTIFIAQVTVLGREAVNRIRVIDTKWLWIDHSMEQNITNLLNIILFIPFGIVLTAIQLYKNRKVRIILVISYCFLFSLLIECSQYITKKGYFEIDDIEANILGGLMGNLLLGLGLMIGSIVHKDGDVK